jgi:cell wall-associated NlpC family hydrolase
MLEPLFISDESWLQCKEELLSWIGTPYRHLKCVKGRGADCTLFLASVWKNIGILKKLKYGYYPRDWHIHTREEKVKNGLKYHIQKNVREKIKVIEIEDHESDFIRGDMLGFATRGTGVTNHTTLWCGDWKETNQKNQMFNSIENRGVCRVTYGSWWKKRLTTILRVMKEVK